MGIVIGTTIFKMPGVIASQTSSPGQLLGLWALGGGLALIGALCYAELGAAYGSAGGDYHYLTRAFGPWAGFLFGWTQLVVIQTVNIGAFAYIFAEFALEFARSSADTPASHLSVTLLAAAIVALMTGINLVGLRSGKIAQNILTLAKVAGIGLLIVAAASVLIAPIDTERAAQDGGESGDWTIAMILIMYAYGGWNDSAFVTTEVRHRERNVPRALLMGVGFVTAIYLAVNVAYLTVLGFEGLKPSQQPPAELMSVWWGTSASRVMSLLVMISTLGAVNGLILAVSRLHAAVGADHRLFGWMGRWGTRHEAPIGSLIVQGVFTVVLLLLVGTPAGRALLDWLMEVTTGQTLPWQKFGGGFDLLVSVGAPVFWTFFLATGIAFLVLRFREPDRPRPFRAPLFPLTPALFCGMCLFGIWASVRWAGPFTWLGVVPVLIGVAAYVAEKAWFRNRSLHALES